MSEENYYTSLNFSSEEEGMYQTHNEDEVSVPKEVEESKPLSSLWVEKLKTIVRSLSKNYYSFLIYFWMFCLNSLGEVAANEKNFLHCFRNQLFCSESSPCQRIIQKLSFVEIRLIGGLIFNKWKSTLLNYHFSLSDESISFISQTEFLSHEDSLHTYTPKKEEFEDIIVRSKRARLGFLEQRLSWKFGDYVKYIGTFLCFCVLLSCGDASEFCTSDNLTFTNCNISNGNVFEVCSLQRNLSDSQSIVCNNDYGGELRWLCWSKETDDVDLFCEDSCFNRTSLEPIAGCDGSPEYNELFGRNSDNPCFCERLNIRSVCLEKYGQQSRLLEDVDCFYYKIGKPRYLGLVENFVVGSVETSEIVKRNEESMSVFANLNENAVIVKQNLNRRIFVKLSKGTYLENFECNLTRCAHQLPDSVFLLSGYLNVVVDSETENLLNTDLEIIAVVYCPIEDCYFCWQTFSYYSCAPPSHQNAMIIGFVALGVLMIFILIRLCDWIGCGCCGFGLRTLMIPMIIGGYGVERVKKTKGYNVIKNYYTPVNNNNNSGNAESNEERIEMKAPRRKLINDEDAESFKNNIKNMKKKYKNGNTFGTNTIVIMCFISMIALSSACSSGLFLPFENQICTKLSSNSQRCEGTYSALVTLPKLGSSVCFTINNTDGVLATGTIIYKEMLETVQLTSNYYTSSWDHRGQSVTYCPTEKTCTANINGGCPETSVSDPSMGGLITDSLVVRYPGRNGCDNGCGCGGCGCFYCTPSCVYWRWALLPKGEIFTVSSPSSMTLRPTIEFVMNGVSTLIKIDNPITSERDISVEILGSLVGDETILASQDIIYSGPNAYIGETSNKNSPIKQTIGDIQASSPTSLVSASPSSFIFDSTICTTATTGRQTTFTVEGSGMDTLGAYSKFPITLGGNVWSYDRGTIKSPIKNPGPLLVKVSSQRRVSFTQNVNLVCPKCNFPPASGCYSCDEGFVIRVNLSSTCLPGLVTLTEESDNIELLTTALNLQTELTLFEIYGKTNIPQNSFIIKVKGNGGECLLDVRFKASQNITLRNDTVNRSSDTETNSALVLSNAFSGNAPWWHTLIAYGVLVVLCILAVIVAPYIIKAILNLFGELRSMIMKKKT